MILLHVLLMPDQNADTPTLEARIRRLEEILVALEGDGVELEQALALFEEGVKHVRAAEETLSATQLRVEELLGGDAESAAGEGRGEG